MAEESPLNVGVIKEKIDKGEVKVKQSPRAKRTKNASKNTGVTNKEHSVKGVNGKISDAEIVAWLKTQNSPVTSTQLRDGLAFVSRTQARRVLRRLAKAGVVKIKTKQLTDKRSIFMFEAVA